MTLPTILPMADVKSKLSEHVNAVQATQERIILTRNGRPVAMLIAVEDFESMQETIEILSDEEQMQRLRDADAEAALGEGLSKQDVDQLLADRLHESRAAKQAKSGS